MSFQLSSTIVATNGEVEPIDVEDMGDGLILTLQEPEDGGERVSIAWTFDQLEEAYVTLARRYRPGRPKLRLAA